MARQLGGGRKQQAGLAALGHGGSWHWHGRTGTGRQAGSCLAKTSKQARCAAGMPAGVTSDDHRLGAWYRMDWMAACYVVSSSVSPARNCATGRGGGDGSTSPSRMGMGWPVVRSAAAGTYLRPGGGGEPTTGPVHFSFLAVSQAWIRHMNNSNTSRMHADSKDWRAMAQQ